MGNASPRRIDATRQRVALADATFSILLLLLILAVLSNSPFWFRPERNEMVPLREMSLENRLEPLHDFLGQFLPSLPSSQHPPIIPDFRQHVRTVFPPFGRQDNG